MMENLLRDGDYVPDGFGGFVRLEDDEGLLQRALFKLSCRRGALEFLPLLGSRLRELGQAKPAARETAAKLYAQEALQGMGLAVKRVKLRMISPEQADISYTLSKNGKSLYAEVRV